ncbi:hypothetical protein EXIGLDRAFT_762643 [Exidia glandulosa HHB12029]|uniref:DUF6532 domain-containing protein n=1 Tax=Exidia glandulosa HHB12029 TaxID=1314781 RepID=A0A165MJ49_EXIGL|nr:hypothetical protein EXIGLDRAFT_762643 [Exidia glandulosa HHB12029]
MHRTKRKAPSSSAPIAVTGASPARRRGGQRSRDPSPVKKRARHDSPPKTRGRAKVIKAAPAKTTPLFLQAGASDGEEDYPDDGMAVDRDGEEPISQEIVDFVTSLNDDDAFSEDDEEDADYKMPNLAELSDDEDSISSNSGEDSENDDGGEANYVTDGKSDSGTDDGAVDEEVQGSVPRGHGLLTSSTPSRIPRGRRPSRSDPTLRTPTATTPSSATAATSYTPYANRVNPKDQSKPLLSHQSPLTRNIVKRAQQLYRAQIITKNAFPDDATRADLAAQFILEAATDLEAPSRIARFQDDPTYQENTVKMVKRTDTQVRGEGVSAAREMVGAAYGLGPGLGNPDQVKRYVELLLANGNFVYRELETEDFDERTTVVKARSGPYRNPVIATLIQQEWFNSHEQMAVSDITTSLFNPIPLPVIAIAATALQCALRDWTTGVRVKSAAEFSSDEWSSIYAGHLRELTHMLEQKPREVDAWTRKLWRDCWSTTSQSLAGNTAATSFISAAELDDFADVFDN